MSSKLKDDPEKLDRVLKYCDYIVDGPGSDLVCYGIKDKNYKVENGKVVTLPEISEVSYSWLHQIMGRKEAEYLAAKFPTNEAHIKFAAEMKYLERYNNFLKIPDALNAADKDKYEVEEITKFIYGKRPLSEFDKFVATLNSTYQLQKYIDATEQKVKEAGIVTTSEQLGLREGRRIKGLYKITVDDLIQGSRHDDAHASHRVIGNAAATGEALGYAASVSVMLNRPLQKLDGTRIRSYIISQNYEL